MVILSLVLVREKYLHNMTITYFFLSLQLTVIFMYHVEQ